MIGKTFSNYRIDREVGSGSAGVVYEAFDTRLRRKVAVKFLHEDIAGDPQILKRFEHEARAAAGLSHPNIVAIHDFDEQEGLRYLVFEFVEGASLKDRLRAEGPLPVADVVRVAAGVARGLQHAHAKGVIHRDIKCANIVVDEAGTAKILDFGFAYLTDATRITRPGFTVGTVAYMSPEQLLAQEVDERSDLWSLGVVLYEILTGKLPFEVTDGNDIAGRLAVAPADPAGLRPDVPAVLSAAVLKCLASRQESRFQTATEVLDALAEVSR